MKILLIDDLRDFIDGREEFAVVSRTPEDGLKRLCLEEPWDEVWLDHDMGLNYDTGDDITIREVWKYLCMEPRREDGMPPTIGTIYVHTSSPIGNEMCSSLRKEGWNVIRITEHKGILKSKSIQEAIAEELAKRTKM